MTTSPSGLTGHQEEWTCTFQDGSQKVIPTEEIALKGIAASSTAADICSGSGVLLLMIAVAIIGARLAMPNQSEI